MKTAKQHNASTRFTFTAKAPREGNRTPMNKIKCSEERDAETGFSYFGTRYYAPDISALWLSVDPMADKYPGISPYAYCAWNPVKLVDPEGIDIYHFNENGVYTHKEKCNGEHHGVIDTQNGMINFSFADSINDPKEIEKSLITNVKIVSNNDIRKYVEKSGIEKIRKKMF